MGVFLQSSLKVRVIRTWTMWRHLAHLTAPLDLTLYVRLLSAVYAEHLCAYLQVVFLVVPCRYCSHKNIW